MLTPLVVLGGLAVVGGALQLPFGGWNRLEEWLHPVVEPAEGIGERHIDGTWANDHKLLLALIALAGALAGIAAAYAVYQRRRVRAIEPDILAQAWYYDRAVSNVMGGPGRDGFEGLAWFDANVVDGAVTGTAKLVQATGGEVRKVQSGYVRAYAGIIGVGVVAALVWFVLVRGIL